MSELTDAQRKRRDAVAKLIHPYIRDGDPHTWSMAREQANTELAAADETLHELLARGRWSGPESGDYGWPDAAGPGDVRAEWVRFINDLEAALMPRTKERSELGREK